MTPLSARIAFPEALDASLDGAAAVTRVVLEQEIHQGFRAKLSLSVPRGAATDLLSLRGHHLTVHLDDEPFVPRIHGLVESVRMRIGEDADRRFFDVDLVSIGERLRHSRRHRIFHDQTVEQIVQQVFSAHDEVEPPAHATERGKIVREYVVQYGESDWDFVRRVLAEGGMVLLTDPGSTRSIVTSDTTREHFAAVTLPFRSHAGLEQSPSPAIRAASLSACLVPDAVVVRAFDDARPRLDLEGRAGRDAPRLAGIGRGGMAGREWFEYEPRSFESSSSGAAHAEQLREELVREEERVECESTAALPAGAHVSITGAPHELDGALLVVRSVTEIVFPGNGAQPRHATQLALVPNRPYRAPRLPKPRIAGTQTAIVRTSGSEEIDVDPTGRIEVEFPWDRRDARAAGALRRVRLAHAWAGATFGMGAIPRVGDEVLVAFMEGDPDDPVVVGRVHNGAAPGPLKLPEQKAHTVWRTQSTPNSNGYNEIRMIDDAGGEVLSLHGERDLKKTVGRDQQTKVGRHDVKKVDGDKQTKVAGDRQDVVEQDQVCCVGEDMSHMVGKAVGMTCETWSLTADERADHIKGDWSSDAAHHWFKDGSFLVGTDNFYAFASANIVLAVGGTRIHITDGKILLTTGGATIVLDGSTITQLASLIDLNP